MTDQPLQNIRIFHNNELIQPLVISSNYQGISRNYASHKSFNDNNISEDITSAILHEPSSTNDDTNINTSTNTNQNYNNNNINNNNNSSSSSNSDVNTIDKNITNRNNNKNNNVINKKKVQSKTVIFDVKKKSYSLKKNKRKQKKYTPKIYFYFPDIIFHHRVGSVFLYTVNIFISCLFSLAYIPYIFLGCYIFGVIKMSCTIPSNHRGWTIKDSFKLLTGTCFFLFGACGFLIYQSIRYYKSI